MYPWESVSEIQSIKGTADEVTCEYDENSHQEGGQQERKQHGAKSGSAVFVSFAAGFHNGCGHGRQEDEPHILHLPYCKGEGAFDAEDELVHATAQEDQLHHLPEDWLEEVILQAGKSSRKESKTKDYTFWRQFNEKPCD